MAHIADFPQPTPNERAHNKALGQLIQQQITEQGGMISFAEFMKFALYHPSFGYYHTLAFHPDRSDFVTAPEISPLFADCLAVQCHALLTHLGAHHIIEIGAGTGRFAGDLLQALEKMGLPSLHYTIYEPSPYLRQQQQIYLGKICPHLFPKINWVETLPSGINGLIIANEVLDALPVHCFRIGKTIEERCVTWTNGQFTWQTCAPFSPALLETVRFLQENNGLANGYESEVNLQLHDFIHSLASALTKGVILLADYGYGQREYYHPERIRGTLTCFYRHHYHHEPLIWPGIQDITSHVDFTRVADIAIDCGLSLAGYTSQSAFLLALGLMQLAEGKEKNFSDIQKIQLHQAIKQLILPSEMGECIKIMALTKNIDNIDNIELLGFSTSDRRRDL